jgi:hypothetical protein
MRMTMMWKWVFIIGQKILPTPKLLCFLGIVVSLLPWALSASGPRDIDQSQLPQILKKTAAYCRKFGSASLYYVCLEDITEEIYSPYRQIPRSYPYLFLTIKKNHYVYDYQLIQKDGDLKEQRILLEENGIKKNVPDAPLKVRRFRYKYMTFGPMLLSEYWQQYHDYQIVAKEKISGEPCLVVEALPKPSFQLEHLAGKIWVRERDFSILRLEYNQETIDNYEGIEETAAKLKARPLIKLITEYAFEEKGIRFPSKYVQSEEYINLRGVHFIKSETTVNYKDYKYFIVETEVEIK